MARVVEDEVGVSRRVPWASYADGRVWELVMGADFEQDPELARRAAIAWANRRGLAVHTSVHRPARLHVQFAARQNSGLRDTA